MAVAVKDKRGVRPQQPGAGVETIASRIGPTDVAASRSPVVKTRATPARSAALESAHDASEEQDPLATRIGTRIILGSLLFDGDWYQQEYPDVAAASLDPVRHYFDNGSREGRNPDRYFDTNWYASNNADVAAAGLNPFLHYLLYGAKEGRKPAP